MYTYNILLLVQYILLLILILLLPYAYPFIGQTYTPYLHRATEGAQERRVNASPTHNQPYSHTLSESLRFSADIQVSQQIRRNKGILLGKRIQKKSFLPAGI